MEDRAVYTMDTLPAAEILAEGLQLVPHKRGRRKKRDTEYIDIVCAFDTETTTIYMDDGTPHSFVYIWQYQFGPHYTITGRTWAEFDKLIERLKEVAKIISPGKEAYFVSYVHNLAFDFVFLQGVYEFSNDDCFFRDVRKPIYARLQEIIEFRCSYLHSNMSLAKFAEQMQCEVRKLDGDKFDYSKIRFPWTPLSDYEFAYCIDDVISLEEAIRHELERDGDTLRTIPLTSTGYVRRDMKKAASPIRMSIEKMLPNLDVYKLLRRCFRGGNTHGNRYHVGTITGRGGSVDIESSYPYQMVCKSYPMGEFKPLDEDKDGSSLMRRIVRLISVGNAVIADYHFKDIRLKNPREPVPYLPISKCKCLNPVDFNDRVLSADLLVTALTEIDLEIVLEQYDFSSVCAYNAYTTTKGPLPQPIRDVVIDYYTRKTQLKGNPDKAYEYVKSKNKLNSCYGMFAQQALHPEITYSQGEWYKTLPPDEEAEDELKKAHFPYQWGVYVTAHARKQLFDGMKNIPVDNDGVSNMIYCDTDSIKYIGKADFTAINKSIIERAKAFGATAVNGKGERHYMGIWDFEGEFNRFITQGAKRYAYEDTKGVLHVTVSGVTKKPKDKDKKILWATEELGNLENFKPGMVWKEAGGTGAVYNDFDNFIYTDPETGKEVHITPNVCIVPTTYTMSMDGDDKNLVEMCMMWLRYVRQREGTYK